MVETAFFDGVFEIPHIDGPDRIIMGGNKMASIQCSKCKAGIHYHGEPEGIEYVIITYHDWETIITSRFNRANKQYDEINNYLKLFRADTIESDFPGTVHKAWKCPVCGTVMVFDEHGRVIKVFEEWCVKEENSEKEVLEYVIFDDYTWDRLTDSTIPDWQIPDQFEPTAYANLTDKVLEVMNSDRACIKMYNELIVIPSVSSQG